MPSHLSQLQLTPQTCMADLGIDSLSKLIVLSEVCGRLGIPQIDLEIHEQLSLDEFGRLLSDAVKRRGI